MKCRAGRLATGYIIVVRTIFFQRFGALQTNWDGYRLDLAMKSPFEATTKFTVLSVSANVPVIV